jgi:UDP-N-acetylmuramate--alanine ligase
MDITKQKHIHFTGIKGVGMTALVQCINDLQIKITGSDTSEIFVTDETLKKIGIKWNVGFGKKNLFPKPDLVIATAAHGGLKNPEVLEAKKMGIPVTSYAEALASLANNKKLISVCGVGGKGSTASIIAFILSDNNINPSFAIGMGNILPLDVSGKYSQQSDCFICEADEYAISPGVNNNPKFSLLNPFITVVTNIEHDHPDIYPTFKDAVKVYKDFLSRIPPNGLIVASADNQKTINILKNINKNVITYGFNKKSDWNVLSYEFKKGQTKFILIGPDKEEFPITLNIPGKFNILNATAAFLVSYQLGVSPEKIIKSLYKYQGARRRFEYMGEYKDVKFYDDYAHHPSEILNVLQATRNWFPKRRIITIFQPHTYSRTKTLFEDFSKAFQLSDLLGIMDIYASARETKDQSVSSNKLAKAIKNTKAIYLKDHKNTLQWIKETIRKGDIVLTLGAGDIFHLYNKLKLK